MKFDRRVVEAIAIVIVSVSGFAAGRQAFAASPLQSFYQSEFGPAVMVALGRGYVSPQPVTGGTLESFLAMRTTTLDRAAVDVERVIDLDQFQAAHHNLFSAVGYWWRLTEISWARLAEVAGFAHALAVTSVFVLLRLFVPVAPAAAGALLFAVAPLQLTYAPHLRDFAKGAFVIAAMPVVVAMALWPLTARTLAGLSALAGAIIGVGVGFKFDVAIMAPIAIASLVLFRGTRPWHGLVEKALAVAVFVAVIGLTTWPILSRQSAAGSNAAHVMLLGYSDWFDTRLGIEPAAYGFMPFYSDDYLQNMLRTRASHITGADAPMPSPEYDRAGLALWQSWVRHFPADHFTRLLAAVNRVLNLAFEGWLARWQGWGWLIGAAIVTAAARVSVRHALFATAFVVALTGYPSLQFDPRHYFHLQAIPIAALVVLLWKAAVLVVRRGRTERAAGDGARLRPLRPAVVTAVLMIAGTTFAPAVTLRAYQERHLRGVFADILEMERVTVPVEFAAAGERRWLAQWPDVGGLDTGIAGLKASYYVVEFRAEAPGQAMAIGLRYSEAPAWTSCAVTQSLATDAGIARFVFPAYSMAGQSAFEGIEMGPEMRSRLIGVSRLTRWPPAGPLTLRLAADWQERRLFQRLTSEERLAADDVRIDAVSARGHCGSEIGLVDATLSPAMAVRDPEVRILRGGTVRAGAGGIRVEGDAEAAAAELAELAPVMMAAGDSLVARVSILRGGALIGLKKDGAWHRTVAVPRPGLSVVVVAAGEPGLYVPVIATAAPGWRAGTTFTIDRIGVVTGARP